MSLRADFAVADRLEVQLEVAPGERVAVVGPNGAGKSTLLACLAGLVRPSTGSATLDGVPLFDTATGRWVPPHARRIALLTQEPMLFPHLTVQDNVAFAPRSAGVRRREARRAAVARLASVGLEGVGRRRPSTLSGGQAQRVGLARALAADPTLLLLDEPLAALDVDVAAEVRQTLRTVLTGRATLLVSHNVLDALLLADRVVVLDAGRIVEQGPTADVLSRPTSLFAASLAGINLVIGQIDGSTVRGDLTVEGVAAGSYGGGTEGVAVFRPNAVAVYLDRPDGSPRNAFPLTITDLLPQGPVIRVRAGSLAADVTPAAVAALGLAPGVRAWFVVKATEVSVYPR
ncbi:MAG: ATP-binding cassette domain-containing protein [Nocardioidaceae bacterium]